MSFFTSHLKEAVDADRGRAVFSDRELGIGHATKIATVEAAAA